MSPYRPATRRRAELDHAFDHHPPCRCGCGELADECAGPNPNPFGSLRFSDRPLPNNRRPRQEPAMTELTDDLKTTVTRLLQIQQTRTELEAEEKHLKTIIRTRLSVGDRGTVNGQPVIAVTPNRRFNADLASETIPGPLLSLCTVTKIDSTLAKKNLPPVLYESCMAEVGEPVVRVL